MSITQTFYDNLATQYDKLFLDWQATTQEQAVILDRIFRNNGVDKSAHILDCACGIGTQAIGLAAMGYDMTASDISAGALAEARERAAKYNARISFANTDFCALAETFANPFDVIIAMDNALPHMLTEKDLEKAKERERTLRERPSASQSITPQSTQPRARLLKSLNGNFYIRYKEHVIVFMEDKYNKGQWRYSIDGEFSKYTYETINNALEDAINNIDQEKT
jgi:ubiquinone/menaquinone biosynthesis C-methylase UbiE